MDNRRLLLAVALSMGLLLLWGYLFPAPEPPVPAETGRSAPGAEAPTATAPAATSPPAAALPAAEPLPSALPPAPPAESAAGSEAAAAVPVEATVEERFVVETAEVRVELTNRGAQLVSFRLLQHRSAKGEPLDLVHAREEGPYPFALVGSDGVPLAVNNVLFAGQRGADGRSFTFRYNGPAGAVEKRFRFTGEGEFEVEIEAPGRSGWEVFLGPGLRNPSTAEIESKFAVRSAVYRVGGEVERIKSDDKKVAEGMEIPGGGLAWVGLEDNYFLTVVMPAADAPLARAVLTPVLIRPSGEGGTDRFLPLSQATEDDEDLLRDLVLRLAPAGERFAATAYWGSKNYERLAALPGGLEATVDLGWFAILARPLMIALAWIYENVVANYGWAIVLMTFAIKILLLPLTHKSTVSMRKMQELNPKMQAIRQKYSTKLKDRQGRPNLESQRKMNEEIMGLYKSEGVNPAGGCLPMLLQLPIFFAFYKILYVTVELRGAPWIGWIHDLSARDPYYILPIIMGVTQFAQQRMMPATGNPMQRRIMMLMPVFFTVLFAGFPAGLVLYWLTNNVLQVAQQAFYNRYQGKAREPAPAASAETPDTDPNPRAAAAPKGKRRKVRDKKKTA